MLWLFAVGLFLLRFMVLGSKTNQKFRNSSILTTEQVSFFYFLITNSTTPFPFFTWDWRGFSFLSILLVEFVSANGAKTAQEGAADVGEQCAEIGGRFDQGTKCQNPKNTILVFRHLIQSIQSINPRKTCTGKIGRETFEFHLQIQYKVRMSIINLWTLTLESEIQVRRNGMRPKKTFFWLERENLLMFEI